MIRTMQDRFARKQLFAIVMAGALALVGLAGCESESTPSSSTPSGLGSAPSEQPEVSEPVSSSSSSEQTGQTAPMPDHVIQESEIIGCWSPDVNAQQPIFIDFFYQDGKLQYDYYQMVLGDGSGIGLANGHSKFEYNNGDVVFFGNQGTCQCLVTNSDKVYIAFYLDAIADGLIIDQEDGDRFYYVGAQCPISEGDSASSSGSASAPDSSSSSSSSSSVLIASPDDACGYLYGLLVNAGQEVPPCLEYDHMDGDGYVIHGYEVVDDGVSTHTGTWFWYAVYPDGTIYDEILQTEVTL